MKSDDVSLSATIEGLVTRIGLRGPNSRQFWAIYASFLIITALTLFLSPYMRFEAPVRLEDYPIGLSAIRDVIVDADLVYVDEVATELKAREREAMVLPLFVIDKAETDSMLESFESFAAQAMQGVLPKEYEGFAGPEIREIITKGGKRRDALLEDARALLREFAANGIVRMPVEGLGRYNRDAIEVIDLATGERTEYARSEIIELDRLAERTKALYAERGIEGQSIEDAISLSTAFARENAFFDEGASAERLRRARSTVEPVLRRLSKGELVIARGEIVGQAAYEKLKALSSIGTSLSLPNAIGIVAYVGLIYALAWALFRRPVGKPRFTEKELILIIAMGTAHVAIAVALSRILKLSEAIPLSLVLPGAFFSMTIALLHSPRTAVLISLIFSLLVLPVSRFDASSFIFSLFSGASASYVVQRIERRIDLVRASGLLAAMQSLIIATILLIQGAGIGSFLEPIFWGAFTGFMCGVLTLGTLPIWEQLLNAPTRFRLMELADLNAPILRRLLDAAPGTFSHSITVANLAEGACREIGADALVARVGAYYHDIGKIDNPGYFIENQSGKNPHDGLDPKRSAAIIKAHVAHGVERASQLGLPECVVDIIGQHHGNGTISWFYEEAKKLDPKAAAEDFRYPGRPPQSREAAVVMLADSVEAAMRSLKNPTPEGIEELIETLFMQKLSQGQLSEAELSLKDLELIRAAFSRILGGHYHSRIEYHWQRGGLAR
jgi:hypothetical protein